MNKPALRAQLRMRRRELSASHPGAGDQAAGHLAVDELPPFSVVAGYHPLGGEIDPWPVLRRLEASGATIALPVALDRHSPLIFRAYETGQPLEPDAVNIPAPTHSAERLIPDLVIAPLLAFDREGHRLGQGAGHYDRTLEGLRAHGRVWVIGLAYAGQQIDRVPCEAHDQPLDAILTETGYHVVLR
ncbi:MAG TPA: 5-formyltetrahydrofolate cyclo-ligase [Caulobacteraceae bacterium]|nr:5-formyltetrahydrofolate cyclo-ligase [Caulobacteraceae bacterium]